MTVLDDEKERRVGTGAKYNTKAFLAQDKAIRERAANPRYTRRHDNVEQFQKCIDDYFDYCHEHDMKPLFGMLNRWVGVGRDKSRFFKRYGDTFKKAFDEAEERVETYYEHLATEGCTAGASFVLKNRRKENWNDDKVVDLRGGGEKTEPTVFKGVSSNEGSASEDSSAD